MHYFQYKDGELHAEDIPVETLCREYGTPLYLYSASTLKRHYHAFDSAFAGIAHLICYSVKANSNLSVLKILAQEGAGMDIVSGGELFRALRAGVPAGKIVFSGVGKKTGEIQEALLGSVCASIRMWTPRRTRTFPRV
jgi:diaminopimelate decarboxylase